MIGRGAPRQMIHPGGEAAVVAVGVPVFEHPLKHRLRHILGGRAVPGMLHEKTEQRAMMALEQFAQRI